MEDFHWAAVAIFAVSLPGLLANAAVVLFIGRFAPLSCAFGRLTRSHAAAEALILVVFACYLAPAIFL